MKLPRVALTSSSVINVVGALLIIYLLVTLGKTVKRNYDLGRQVEDLRGQITRLESQKNELAYSIEYYKTDSFRDREARSKLGLQLPGENVIIIPRTTPAAAATTDDSTNASKPKSNFQQWLTFLKGRS